MSNGKISIPAALKTSSLSNLTKTAMTRSVNTAAEVLYVDPEDCYAVINPRKKFNQDLIEVYTEEFLDPAQGQREPCTVYPKDEKGYRIHHGATRMLAGKKAKETKPDWKLKVIIDPALANRSPLENFWEQGTNNINRDNMSVFDQADWMAECIELAEAEGTKLTQADLARRLTMSKAQVSRIFSLRKAPLAIREVQESGKTTDPETLSNLVKINAANPELFKQLIEKTELDRSTVREVAKTGRMPEMKSNSEINPAFDENVTVASLPEQEPAINKKESDSVNIEYFVAHAQQNDLSGIELSSGKCFILTIKTDKGYQAAATTSFEHEQNLKVTDNLINYWGDESAALSQAMQNLHKWTYEVEKNKHQITDEQLEDALLVRDWLSLSQTDTQENDSDSSPVQKPLPKKKKTIVTTGTWNGLDCVLVTSLDSKMLVDKGNIIEEAEAEGLVYVRLSTNELKKIQPEEFHLKSVKFSD